MTSHTNAAQNLNIINTAAQTLPKLATTSHTNVAKNSSIVLAPQTWPKPVITNQTNSAPNYHISSHKHCQHLPQQATLSLPKPCYSKPHKHCPKLPHLVTQTFKNLPQRKSHTNTAQNFRINTALQTLPKPATASRIPTAQNSHI